MPREGTPWQGLGIVWLKEMADHLSSARMRVLEWLVVLTAMAALYGAIQSVRDTVAEVRHRTHLGRGNTDDHIPFSAAD